MTRTQKDREFDWQTGRELERKDAEIDRLKAAIKWALGETSDASGRWFEPLDSERRRPYWWRSHLRKLSGVDGQITLKG